MQKPSPNPERPSREVREWPAWFLPAGAIACALLWGSAFPSIKFAYHFVDGGDFGQRVAFAGIRFTLAGLVLLCLVRGRRGHLRNIPKSLLVAIISCQVVIQYVCFYWGIALISGMLSAIIQATGSFWWVFFAPLAGQASRPSGRQLALLLLGFAGVSLCVLRSGNGGEVSLMGVGLALMSTLAGTAAVLMVRPAGRLVPIPFLTGFSLFCGGLVLMAMSPGAVVEVVTRLSTPLILITLHLAMVSAVAFSLWFALIMRFDISRMSGYRFLIPVCGVLESALLIEGERMTIPIMMGGALVVLSVWLLERLKRTGMSPVRSLK